MMGYTNRVLQLVTVGLLVTSPVANAWNLVNKANFDPHPSPIRSPDGIVSVSGTSHAFPTSVPNRYPGNVSCGGDPYGRCDFGPVASSVVNRFNFRYVMAMGCQDPSANDCNRANGTSVPVHPGMTWEAAISAWHARYGSSVSRYNAFSYGPTTRNFCMAWATYSIGYYYLLPGTDTCGPASPVPTQCNVSGGAVALNHGLLKAGDITGKTTQVTRQIRCSRPTSIRYSVSVGNPVDLGNGITSTLSVNGRRAGVVIGIPGGSGSLTFSSTLTDLGANLGAFSKTVILIQNFM